MKSKIFDPSEMKNTFVKHSELNIFNENEIAKGYICSISNGYVLPEYFEDYNYLKFLDGTIGDGNIFSTVDDLLKFDNALNSGKIISNQSLSEMFTSGILSNNDTIEIELKGQSYGYGWRIRNSQIGKIVWHSGHLPGISNLYVKNLENNITIFILSNNGFETYKIYDTILEIITNTQMEEPKIFGEIALKKFLHDNKISEKLQKFEILTNNKFTLFRENQINEIGYELIELNRYFDALKIFELNIIKFPNSANAFDSYAEICLLLHDTTSAINNYQKALDIDPLYANSEYAKLIINQLKK